MKAGCYYCLNLFEDEVNEFWCTIGLEPYHLIEKGDEECRFFEFDTGEAVLN